MIYNIIYITKDYYFSDVSSTCMWPDFYSEKKYSGRNHGIFFKTNICKCFVQIWTHEWTLIQSVFCDCLLVKYLNCAILLSVERLIWSQFYLTPSFSKILICLLFVLLCVSIISQDNFSSQCSYQKKYLWYLLSGMGMYECVV